MRARLLAGLVFVLAVALVAAVLSSTGGGNSAAAPAAAAAPPKGSAAPSSATSPRAGGRGLFVGRNPFERIPAIVRKVEPSVVSVLVQTDQGGAEGSGVIWDSRGTLITNNHVVQGAKSIQVVLASGQRLPATVKATDPLVDLAVLIVPRKGLPRAAFSRTLPDVGELAIALGNPLGFENSVTAGIVSGLHRAIPSGGQTPALVDLVQTDAAISPGNSGGALVDADGRVIGINVAFIPPQARAVSLGFAIPAPTVVSVVEQLIATGKAQHAFLGVRPADLTPAIAQRFDLSATEGVIVISTVPGSAAEKAGLRPGDVIVAGAGAPVRVVEDLFAALRRYAPGQSVTLTVLRDGKPVKVSVTLTGRPGQ